MEWWVASPNVSESPVGRFIPNVLAVVCHHCEASVFVSNKRGGATQRHLRQRHSGRGLFFGRFVCVGGPSDIPTRLLIDVEVGVVDPAGWFQIAVSR